MQQNINIRLMDYILDFLVKIFLCNFMFCFVLLISLMCIANAKAYDASGFIITSPPIGGGRGIVMPLSVCLCVCVCVCLSVFSQNFKV